MPKAKEKASKAKAPAKKRVVRRKTPQQDGTGIKEFLQGVNKFLKKTKIISGVAGALSAVPGIGEVAAPVSAISGLLGYGMAKKKPMRKGAKPTGGIASLTRTSVPSVRRIGIWGQFRHLYTILAKLGFVD
jgi:hypothetical protein